jgi:dihydroneopterin aldolase
MHKIQLHGMRFMGRHGVLPEEQNQAQPFIVDVEVEGEFPEASTRDDLALTLDYRELYRMVKHTIEEERFYLLEALSDAVAGRILRLPGVVTVTVRIKKPQVQLGGPLDYAAVEITRRRAS